MTGFVDNEKLKQLVNRLTDLYRELGMTVGHVSVGVDPEGAPIIQVTALVRETAYEMMNEDLEVKKLFSQQMAAENQHRIDAQAEAIERAAADGSLMDVILGKRPLVQCSHERIHEGLCLDCQAEVPNEA